VTAITVSGLNTYPIKACGAVGLLEARITPRGLEHDRDYMLVTEDGAFLSQRQIPEMALIRPTIGTDAITLNAPGMAPALVPLVVERDDAALVDATVHGKPVVGQVVAAELNDWFTAFLPPYKQNRGYRLLRVREDAPRYISANYRQASASNEVGFADGHSILLAAEASLAQLNTEMDSPVPMNRFRPNIVVDGPGLAPYDEDFWTELRIGEMGAFVVKACDRCAVPDVDQETAATGKEVRRALRSRRGANAYDASNTGVFFAQNLAHVYVPELTIRVGDTVDVLSRSEHPNVVLRNG
jgi:uncharacterized protein YcbX